MNTNAEPLLRFKKHTKQWCLKRLGDYYSFKNGINAEKDQYGSGIKFINVLDVLQDLPITSQTIAGKVSVDSKSLEKNSVIRGDVLFQRSSETREEVGTSNVYLDDETVTFGGFVIRGRATKKINPVYLNYLLKSSKARKEITTKSGGSTHFNVGQATLSDVQIYMSDDDNEQQKIADFLTSVDTKISQLTEKHRLLKEYKKGVMQQIFSQQIRFKDEDGKAFPEWEWKPLSELATKKTSKNKDQTIKDVLTNSARDGVVPQREYFEKDIATEGNTENYYIVDIDDFVYNPRISELAPVGPINRNKVGKGIMSPLYSVFRFKKHTNVEFIEFFFKGSSWHRYMISVANIGARYDRMNISSSDLMSLPCPCPIAEEQQKIAAFLQSIDNKIDAVAKQIDYTKQFKQGLLQQMFV